MSTVVKAVYAHLDCLVDGVDAVKKAGLRENATVIAPLPRHEIEELMYDRRPSPVRWFTMCGAIFGFVCGPALASISHLNWPMIIPAGKPLVSIPTWIVICFECTVLFGCLFTLAGLLLTAGLPARKLRKEIQDPRFSDDHFGIIVDNLAADQAEKLKATLHHTGAVEVSAREEANA